MVENAMEKVLLNRLTHIYAADDPEFAKQLHAYKQIKRYLVPLEEHLEPPPAPDRSSDE
jgi:hypothetical protein